MSIPADIDRPLIVTYFRWETWSLMNHSDDLKARIDGLNEAERVEYNRRLQLLKSTKEAANSCLEAIEISTSDLQRLKLMQSNFGVWEVLIASWTRIFSIARTTHNKLCQINNVESRTRKDSG